MGRGEVYRRIRHEILIAKFHDEYGAIVDKVQVTIYTNEADVLRILSDAKKVFDQRDERIAGILVQEVPIAIGFAA